MLRIKIKIIVAYCTIIALLTTFQMCSDTGKDPIVEENPVIELINLNSNWNLAEMSYNKVEAKILDPQGVENIDSVAIRIFTLDEEIMLIDRLYDDGAYYYPDDGDVIAGDGVFSNRFDAATDIGKTVGDYKVEIQAFDFDGNQSEISDTTIHLGYSYTVEFVNIQKPDTIKSGIVAEYLYVALRHPEGLKAIKDVSFNLYVNNSTALLKTMAMFNDGNFENTGDLIAADSIFSFKMDSSFAAGLKGLYDLEFTVTDEFGSITKSGKFDIFLENKVGRILELTVPDQMTLPATEGQYTRALLTAHITDPQGLSDVDSVYFFSLKPNGEYANDSNPFILIDNGKPFNIMNPYDETGDIRTGDGIYSFSLLLYNNPQTVIGTYVFTFYMRDKVGNLTAVKTDSLEVN